MKDMKNIGKDRVDHIVDATMTVTFTLIAVAAVSWCAWYVCTHRIFTI